MTTPRDTTQGVLAAVLAYVIWGVIVVYWKLLPGVAPWEILAHRVIWSLVLLAPIIVFLGRTAIVWSVLRNRRSFLALLASSALIAVNWGLFIWAVTEQRIVETSLGYYINPLFAILLGVVLLGEKLSRIRVAAFGLAAAGVVLQAVAMGGVPFISLGLAASFAVYGYVRKVVKAEALDGLFVETLIVSPFALAALAYFANEGSLAFAHGPLSQDLLMIGAGAVTALPLWLFAVGARQVRLSTMGFLQYIAPTISLILAVTIYDEPFDTVRLVSFGLIWAALAVVSVELFRRPVVTPPEACG